MLTLGLSRAQQDAYQDLLMSHHSIDIRLQIMDLNHNHVSDIADRLVDGQVTVDAISDVTRSLDLDLLDPSGGLHMDSDSPNDGALFADRMIRVVYRIVNPAGTASYSAACFTGPVTRLERTGVLLKVECQGKEIFGLTPSWNTKTFKRGMKVTTAIRQILNEIIGENKLHIPDRESKLPKNVSVGGDKLPWLVAKNLASSIGFQLYYDGDGVAVMRKIPSNRCFTFKIRQSVKTSPEVGFSIEDTINAVEVWGKKPKKGKKGKNKKRPHARVVAPRTHPLSPWKLGRSGGPRYLPKVIEDDGIRTDLAARQRANQELKRGLLESIEVAYDTLVFPHLEELDVVGISTDEFGASHRLFQFAIPLTAAGVGSVGYVKNVKPNLRVIRARRRPRNNNRRRRRRQR